MKIKPETIVNIGILLSIIGACVAGLATTWTRIQRPELTETQLFLETAAIVLIGAAMAIIGAAITLFGKKKGG